MRLFARNCKGALQREDFASRRSRARLKKILSYSGRFEIIALPPWLEASMTFHHPKPKLARHVFHRQFPPGRGGAGEQEVVLITANIREHSKKRRPRLLLILDPGASLRA